MLIAAAANGQDLDSTVSDKFEQAEYLLIIDAGSMRVEHIVSARADEHPALHFARQIVEWDCEAVLCGEIEEVAFNIIAVEGQVTRYMAAGLSVSAAVDAMESYELEYIKTYVGGGGCDNHGHQH